MSPLSKPRFLFKRPSARSAIRHRPANTLGRKILSAGLACGVIWLVGCRTNLREWAHQHAKVGPTYHPPGAPVELDWVQTDPRVRRDPPTDCAWWTVFNDPVLNGLIETAYRQNLDVRTAGTRILEARAQRNVAVGNLFPQQQQALALYAHAQIPSAGIAGLPVPSEIDAWATGFNASWEFDVWGRLRRSIESSDATLGASFEDYGDVMIMMLSDVATTYMQLRTFEQRLAFARSNVTIQEGSTQLAEYRFHDGVSSELDVRQARASLAQTRAIIPQLEVGRRQASNRLCVLLGVPVADLAGAIQAGSIPKAPPEVAVGIPADLLRRRPDVRRAERRVAAQSAQIGVAEADLYPRLSMLGFLGYSASDFNTLFSARNFTALTAPNLQWNVLNYGRIVNNIRAQDARLAGVALQYQQSVLNAGREVEDSLVAFLQNQEQSARLEESVAESQRAVELVIAQFKGGVADFNRVYTTQTQLVNQQDQLASALGNIDISLINVYRALGGGWTYFVAGRGMPAIVPYSEGAVPATGADGAMPTVQPPVKSPEMIDAPPAAASDLGAAKTAPLKQPEEKPNPAKVELGAPAK